MKLFVLVRKDLSPSQQAVQAGHAVAELLLNGSRKKWDNGTLVYLGVKNEEQLERWAYKLDVLNREYSRFREPDLDNQTTAIATVGQNKIFKRLQLL